MRAVSGSSPDNNPTDVGALLGDLAAKRSHTVNTALRETAQQLRRTQALTRLAELGGLIRLQRNRDIRSRRQPQITAGVMGVCPVTELELLYSARSKAEREEWLELLNAAFAWIAVPERVFTRAVEVQAAMTARGTHRSAGVVDLIPAATAELNGLTLVHYDRDFGEISKVPVNLPSGWPQLTVPVPPPSGCVESCRGRE